MVVVVVVSNVLVIVNVKIKILCKMFLKRNRKPQLHFCYFDACNTTSQGASSFEFYVVIITAR